MDVVIRALNTERGRLAIQGSRPIVVNNMQPGDYPSIVTPRGMVVNSLLRKDEWERLDQVVVEAASQRLVGVRHLIDRGLTQPLGSLGVLTSQWNVSSQMTAANVSMSGATAGQGDLVDFNLAGRPVPVIFKEYQIGLRQLEADRLAGNAVDTTNATEAGRVVAEKLEDMLFNGLSSLNFNGDTIYGYTTEPNRNTDTAANYGGGDWGTSGNPVKTVAGMINAAAADYYYGPYGVYVATTQYYQAANTYYTDGSGDTEMDRILKLPGVEFVEHAPVLADGVVILVQLTRDVVDLAGVNIGAQMVQNLEWSSDDGMTSYFKVLVVAVPRVKSDYNSRSGVVHATGA